MTVPVERPITLTAFAEDTTNDVVAVAWDRDAQRDSNGDGDPANDEDVVCSTQTPCAAKPTEMGATAASKASVPALWAPELTLTWNPGDGGLRTVRVMARDALGNVAFRDIRLSVLPTEIRIEEYNPTTGQLRGSVYPPQPNVELQLLRLRDKEVSELQAPVPLRTDGASRFVIDGVLPGQGTVLLDRTGSVVEGEQQKP